MHKIRFIFVATALLMLGCERPADIEQHPAAVANESTTEPQVQDVTATQMNAVEPPPTEDDKYGRLGVLKPIRDEGYAPFSIVSTKLGTALSSDELESHYMCRVDAIAPTVELIQNYDVVGTDPMDGSIASTSFAGRQNGEDVLVEIWAIHNPQMNSYVYVNKKEVMHCG